MRKSGKPLLSVSKETSVRRPYTLRHDVAQRIDDYAAFLSEFNKATVKAGDVVEKLADRLEKDPLFLDWLAKRGDKGAATPRQGATNATPAATADASKPRTSVIVPRGESATAATGK